MKFLIPLAGAGVLLAAAATWRAWSAAEPPPRALPERPKEAPPQAAPARAAAGPTSAAGTAALQVASRLDEIRLQVEIRETRKGKPFPEELRDEETRRKEAAVLGESLKDRLAAHPEEWPDVVAQISRLENLMVLLELTAMISPVVDPAVEPLLIRQMRDAERLMARRAAVALLADSPQVEALQAFIDATQMDADSGVRLAAFIEMMRRAPHPDFQSYRPSIEETVKRQTTVEPDPNVRQHMCRFLPGQGPPPPAYKPRSKGGLPMRAKK